MNTVANIQILRAFAALAVAWRHMLMWFGTDPGWGLLHVGRAGVDVFFVISGFIMFHTTQAGARTTTQFWTDRVVRIAPLYWLMTLLIAGLYLAGLPAGDVQALDGNDVPLALAFVPNYRGDADWNPILATGWTLIFEMYFYFLFGLTFFLRSQARALVLLTVFFIAFYAISQLVSLPFTPFRWSQPITLEFAAGGLLALLYRRPFVLPRLTAKAAGWGLIVAGVIAFFVVAYIFTDGTAEPTALRTLVNGPPAVMVVAGALLLEKSGVVWNSPTLLLLGAASYSIYLGHLPVLQYASLLWADLSPAMPGLMPVFYAATYVAAVLLGLALYFSVEKPVHKFLKARLRRGAVRPAVAV
jgi:exopolysaccharide production protein ExoZ